MNKKLKKDLLAVNIDEKDDFKPLSVYAEEAGVEFSPRKAKLKELPRDLTAEPLKGLGQAHSYYSSFMAYVNQQIASTKHLLRATEDRFRSVRSRALFAATGPFKAKQFAKVNMDPNIQRLRAELLAAKAQVAVWHSVMWTIKGYLEAIKFETERRRIGFRQ